MVKSRKSNNSQKRSQQYDRLTTMGKTSVNIINELYNPIDAVNRFINLALQNMDDNSQSRQFLLDSKLGIRRMAILVKRLNKYAKRIEKEARNALRNNE